MDWIGWTNWLVTDYIAELQRRGKCCNGQQTKVEAEMEKMFHPCQREKIDDPCIIVDKEGVILLWYLPGMLSWSRQVCNGSNVSMMWD